MSLAGRLTSLPNRLLNGGRDTRSRLESSVIESISAVNANQWNNLVAQSDRGGLFHRYEWLRAIEEGLSAEPRHVIVTKGNNPVAILPTFRHVVDVPAGDSLLRTAGYHALVSSHPGYGGPLVATNTADCLELLFGEVASLAGPRTVYHLIRVNDTSYARYGKQFAKRGYTPQTVTCRIEVDLNRGWDDIVADMRKERRKAVRQAHEQDWQVRTEPPTRDTLERVHEAYRANMDRVGSDPYPLSFFEALGEHLGDRLRVTTAIVAGREVGSFVSLVDEDRSTVHYFFSAIGDEANYGYHPAELLHGHSMRWGIDNGYDRYDFGDSPADYSDGLFRYKEKYSGRIIPTLQWQKGQSRHAWPAFKTGRALYRKVSY